VRRWLLLLRLSARNVFRNRARSLFALATIAIGALGLQIFMGFNTGLMNQYRANAVRAHWGHGQLATKGYHGSAHARPWQIWIVAPARLLAELRGLPHVRHAFPRVSLGAMIDKDGELLPALGEGIDGPAEGLFFDQLNYVEGGDFGSHPAGIVLGLGLARGLGAKVGDTVDVMTRNTRGGTELETLSVTGIYHTGVHEFDNQTFRIPIALAQRMLGTDRVEHVYVALDSLTAWPAFAAAVSRTLPELEAIPFEDLDQVYYRHAVDWLDAQFAFIRAIVLLVVFLGIFNVVSMAVVERTQEIGTLRANGDSRSEVAAGQMLEAAIVGLLGGVVGLALGWALCAGPLRGGIAMPPAPGITRSYRIPIELHGLDALHVLTLCALVAVAGCLVPVWRATRISIVQALRQA
jgi:putative ABC transport system permease protein